MAKSLGKQRGSTAEATAARTQSEVTETQARVESLSVTTKVSVSGRIRGVVVGVNLVVVLLSLIVLWSSMYSFQTRPSQPTTFLGSLGSNSFLFTLVMYFDVFLIILSVLFISVATCGLVGALRENLAVLEAYQCLLAIVILVNSVAAIAGTVWPRPGRNSLKESSYKEFIQGYRHNDEFQSLIDALQKSLQCCGFSQDSFRDWSLNEYFRCDVGNPSRERCAVPHSCCRSRSPNGSQLADELTAPRFCGHGVLLMSDEKAWERVYTRSCADAALSFVTEHVVEFVGLGMLLNMFLLFMVITSVVLQDQVKVVRSIYNAYYKTLAEGQEAMERSGIKLPEKAAEGPPGACWIKWGGRDKTNKPTEVGKADSSRKRMMRMMAVLPSP